MEKEEERQEYVLNPTGKIWCGTFRQPRGKPWIFGQFDDVVLPAAVFLLEKSNLSHSDRGSPILVARAISAVVRNFLTYFKISHDHLFYTIIPFFLGLTVVIVVA